MSRNIHYSSPSKKTNQAKIPLVWSLLIALLAGGVFSFALAPYHYWWLALLSPAVLYACVHQRSAKQAAWIGLAYGFGLWFVGAFWLYTSIHLFGAISSPVAVLMVAVMAFVMALFSAAQLYVYRRFFPETPLAFAPVWVVFEWLKTWLFTGFPWLFVGYAFTERFLDHVAPIFGVLGVSFIAVLLACAGAELLRKRWVWLVPSAVVLLSTWAVGQITWVQQKNTAPLSVSLVQGNIQQDLKWQQQQFFKTLQTYTQLSEQEWGRDLVVWPESAVPSLQTSIPEFFDDVGRVAQASSSTWLTGVFYEDTQQQKIYNSVMALGASQGVYHKQRLVPFGEYIPLAGLLYWVLPEMQKDVANGGLVAGEAAQKPLKIKQHDLAVAICYEVAYPHLTRSNAIHSDFLMTVSNDAWFVGTAGPWQHLQMVQMRAKENGRWFIRATNTGVTAIINEQGHIVSKLPQDIAAVLRGDLPAMEGRTWYSRFSDYPILIVSLLLLLIGWRYRKS